MEMARQVALLCDDVRTKEHAILLLNEQLTTMETTGQRDHRTPSQRSVTDAEEQLVRMKVCIFESYVFLAVQVFLAGHAGRI